MNSKRLVPELAENDDIGSSGKAVALEKRDTAQDGRRFSPSAGRNKAVIADVLSRILKADARILEIASGTGEHGAHFVSVMPQIHWTYSDVDAISRASQSAWVAHHNFGGRLTGPVEVDAAFPDWGEAEARGEWDAIFCANMIHIAPFETAEGLIAGAGRLLRPGGMLIVYGPFARNGEIADSNARFSEDLKRRDPSWGVRDLDRDIAPLATSSGLEQTDIISMPANNLIAVFQKT